MMLSHQERRHDLESLDLAIERQKTHLHTMNKKEQKIKAKRDLAKQELGKLHHKSRDHKAERQ